jgi:glycosyltransferase involved in cell wall biosynthesis
MLSQSHIAEISAVVPTRDRQQHLSTLLHSLAGQTILPREVIIVDSSVNTSYHKDIIDGFPNLNIIFIGSSPSVCRQRNTGIKAAKHEWILLIDDDIEIDPSYIETLLHHAEQNEECGAFAGRLMQKEGDQWVDQYPPPSAVGLLHKFIFQLPVWGDILNSELGQKKIFAVTGIRKFYERKGNTFALSGWPLITSWDHTFKTTIYSLGANLIKREWLLDSPYSEVLDANGIGDNFGVALGFPSTNGILVTDDTRAFHHRAPENRLSNTAAYYKRILALQFFISQSKRFTLATMFWFVWSLLGNALLFFVKGKFKLCWNTFKATVLILVGKNPYALRHRRH